MKRTKNRRGQSTVEYVIVFTAIAAAIIFAATQGIKPAVNKTYNQAGGRIDASGDFFANKIGYGQLDPEE